MIEKNKFKRTKYACYTAYFTMSSIFCVPPLLFVTFKEMYGISYTLLGTLVLVNFCTQLGIDIIFTFFSKYFNPKKIVRVMPFITALGLSLYALIPTLFPNIAYIGLLIGTVIFSVSAGLSEVLLSPMIAAIPSDTPQKDMSTLHSLYAFGVCTMVTVSTVFLKLFGTDNWMYLVIILALLPVIAAIMFIISPMPDMQKEEKTEPSSNGIKRRALGLALCIGCIFFGSCAENAMGNWISSFMENALGIEKSIGDILGVTLFAVLLGIARISYAKFGKNILRVLLLSMIGATVCYLVVGLSQNVIIVVLACAMTGFCTSMLWPGTLIMMEEKIPNAGVAAFALMAAGGDLGASFSPQLVGIVIDSVSTSKIAADIGNSLGVTAEQIALKAGMLVCAVFPIIGIAFVVACILHFKKSEKKSESQ